jgi:hypothetical protein
MASLFGALLLTLAMAATPPEVRAADYDVNVDACALLDDATIESLTAWTDFTTDGGRSSASVSACFWGSVVGGEPGYVELVVVRQGGLEAYYSYADDCLLTPVSDVGADAAYVECPTEVSLYAYEQGAVVSLLVDQPSEPLAADELGGIVRSVFAQLDSVVAAPSPSTGGEAGGAPTVCLAEEVESAIEGYSGSDPVTEPPAEDVADALAVLTLTGSADEARDALVSALSSDPPDEFSLALGANRFRAEVRIDCSVPPAPSAEPDPEPEPEPEPAPIESDGGASGGGPVTERPFAASVPAPGQVSTDPIVLLQSAALAALLVFLMPFPSQLFNSTLETHEDEVKRWLRLDRLGGVAGGIGAFWASWPGVALFTLLAALLYGFLDPGFGFDVGSLATFLGMLLGIVLVTAAFAIPTVLAHRRLADRPSLKVVPLSLLIGVVCVLLSRLTSFQPGYLYGLLIGLAFARELSQADEGRATAVGALLMLAVAFVSWIGLGALPDGAGFGLVAGRTALAALMVAGLEGVVFGLLPMRFLPGESLYGWNRVVWAALLGIGAFAFFHILINPASGYLSDTSRTPLLTVLGLLIGFSIVSVAFWGWFRFRSTDSDPDRATT